MIPPLPKVTILGSQVQKKKKEEKHTPITLEIQNHCLFFLVKAYKMKM